MRFGTWNMKSLYKAGLLMTVTKEVSIQIIFSGITGSQMGKVTPNQQANTHFPVERGMRIMNWVQVFLYIRESHQQLRR
jgi:hypothetical protein